MHYPPEYLIGILLFNRGDWFEAHDAWEEIWRGAPGPDRNFYQGLIQIAVSLCHRYNGNDEGARRLVRSAMKYLLPYAPGHLGLDLVELGRELRPYYIALGEDPFLSDSKSAEGTPAVIAPLSLTSSRPLLRLNPQPEHWPPIPVEGQAS